MVFFLASEGPRDKVDLQSAAILQIHLREAGRVSGLAGLDRANFNLTPV
jgi:hypothetical protein